MQISTGVQAILKFCLSNLKGCNVGITDGRDLCRMVLKWAQMAWYTNKVCAGVQAKLRFCFRNLRGCSVGIASARNLWRTPLKWTQVIRYTYKVPRWSVQEFKYHYGYCCNNWYCWSKGFMKYTVEMVSCDMIYIPSFSFALEIWRAETLVILTTEICELCRWDMLRFLDIHMKSHKVFSAIQKLIRSNTHIEAHRQQDDFISLILFFSK
jgi:hypothetical protein